MELREILIPKQGVEQVVTDKLGKVTMYLFSRDGHYSVMGFIGKRSKPAINYRFSRKDKRDEYAEQWMRERSEMFTEWESRKASERKNRTEGAKASVDTIQVGDLFVSTCSYNMTINSFYQVVHKVGKKLVVVQADSDRKGDGWSGTEYARKVTNEPTRKHYAATINGKDRIKVEDGYTAYKTSETEGHTFNHLD